MTRKIPFRTGPHKFDDDNPFEFLMERESSPMLDPNLPIISIMGEVEHDMATEFIKSLNILKKRGEGLALLDISSPGGDLFALFRMLNAMDSCEMLFSTYNSSYAYSAAAVLLAAGSRGARFVAPLSSTMLHPMSCGVSHQQIEDVTAQAAHDKELNDTLLDRLAKHLGMTRTKLNKELQKPSGGGSATLWMTPERCIELGIADVIGIPSFSTETKLTVFGNAEPAKTAKPTRKAPQTA